MRGVVQMATLFLVGKAGQCYKAASETEELVFRRRRQVWLCGGGSTSMQSVDVSDPDVKATVALVYREMTSHSLDGVKRAEVDIIPLIFLGMHGQSEGLLCA